MQSNYVEKDGQYMLRLLSPEMKLITIKKISTMITKMKTTVASIFIALICFSSCSSDDDNNSNDVLLEEDEIPTEITSYVSTHFETNSIFRAEKETENNKVNYNIYLETSYELEFNSDFEIIEIDGITQLPDSVIPELILDYVTENYPDNVITDWELETNYQQVELNNGYELEFGLNGDFIRLDLD
ncbi:PepSY-like domain-containing protein [Formosa sp. L2A11]|uniref:PepSY-like domain-containing protein n=1 Tax=Formosa sp. L2A11 TaxID=2686363 RepID=UPI00131ECC24|nr:PepSY-like domain-containing protein [Formosa sp. L2A11]